MVTDKIKLQSAMEYLMTYGWAILIIAVVLGALFQLGVFNSSSFSPRAPPGACQVFRPSGPGTTTNINLMGVCTGQLPQYVAQFDGASSYVNVGNSIILQMATRLSVSYWIYPTSTSGYQYLVSKGIAQTTGWWSQINLGTSTTFFCVGASPSGVCTAIQTLTLNAWQLVTYTYDAGSGYYCLNGICTSYSGLPSSVPSTSTRDLIIGNNGGGGWFFSGRIANVQIYNASLSANQVQALYLEGMGGAPIKVQNIIGWWPLNGNSNDYSGNNNNGVPTSVTFTSQYGK